MKHIHYPLLIILFLGTGFWLFSGQSNKTQAQPRITNTAVPVVIPTTAPTNTAQAFSNIVVEASPSPTFTPTQPLPDARLISIAASGTALVRDFPETGTILGVLQDNTDYQVLGQYFSWYQIQYSIAPDGRAWVYFADIRVSGNLEDIPFADPNVEPAQFSAQDFATATALVLFQTPGFAETATAESRVLEIDETEINLNDTGNGRLATYTPPAEIIVLQATSVPNVQPSPIAEADLLETTRASLASGNIPPILPIIGLFIFGLLGLLIARVRK